ncbi:hypothetical protein BS78_05G206200 [Paspalum vaginatum]|uniref:Knottins-like domain-containing protein n=1 Tax=Paspalum vaginatum TaxID=158149 RepID=A0A9W8CG08_9POAL|nr:hypothetical protein BS78_K314200 [Paspalum vaginatum]KAJ1276329.1 hypothetical protein BS78_05G206200 [Paspalum vaginatum]
MAPSGKNLSAAALLLLVIMAVAAGGTMASAAAGVGPLGECKHLSGNFHGPCGDEDYCNTVCLAESPDNIRGECDNHHPFSRCVCVTNCLRA